jgi:Tol biopolymer transport system component
MMTDKTSGASETFEQIEWIATADMGIGYDRAFKQDTTFLTPAQSQDYKPAFSPDHSQIAFFRVFSYNTPANFNEWDTRVAVMNADGSDVRFISSLGANHVPKWTQDGSNRIVFSTNYKTGGGKVFWTSPQGSPGQEELLTSFTGAGYEENGSALHDGRILVQRWDMESGHGLFAMSPIPAGQSTYQALVYAPKGSPEDVSRISFNKITVSPSGHRIAYMKMVNGRNYYTQSQIAYADWDAATLTISNEVVVAHPCKEGPTWYPCFTPNEEFIVYAQNGQVMACHFATGETKQISAANHEYRYVNVAGVIK